MIRKGSNFCNAKSTSTGLAFFCIFLAKLSNYGRNLVKFLGESCWVSHWDSRYLHWIYGLILKFLSGIVGYSKGRRELRKRNWSHSPMPAFVNGKHCADSWPTWDHIGLACASKSWKARIQGRDPYCTEATGWSWQKILFNGFREN